MRQPKSSGVQYYQQQGTGRLNTPKRDIKASEPIDPHRNSYIYIYIYIYIYVCMYRDPLQRKAQKTFNSRVQFPIDVQQTLA